MSQHDEDTKETLTASIKGSLTSMVLSFAAMGAFAFVAWNSSASGFSGLSLNALQDFKQEEFLQSVSQTLSTMKVTSRVNTRDRSIKIFSSELNFEHNSTRISSRQSLALGRVAQLVQAAFKCTDSGSDLQLAAKPLDGTPVMSRSECNQGEKIEFTCKNDYRNLRIKHILVSANEPSHTISMASEGRRTPSQVFNQRNEVLINAFHVCEPELSRYSYIDSKPVLRLSEKNLENAGDDLERVQIRFEFY